MANAKSSKSNSLKQKYQNNKQQWSKLALFVLAFAGLGAWTLLKSNAATLNTSTTIYSDANDITASYGSGNYSVISEIFNGHNVQVAKINTLGMISFGGKGGGLTAAPTSQKSCYILRVDVGKTATVQLRGNNGTISTATIKGWPYNATPIPYQYQCVGNGTTPNKSVPDIQVLSGGPVYFYQRLQVVSYPY